MPRAKHPELVLVGMRLMKRDIDEARRAGRELAIPYQHVIRGWVAEMAKVSRAKQP